MKKILFFSCIICFSIFCTIYFFDRDFSIKEIVAFLVAFPAGILFIYSNKEKFNEIDLKKPLKKNMEILKKIIL